METVLSSMSVQYASSFFHLSAFTGQRIKRPVRHFDEPKDWRSHVRSSWRYRWSETQDGTHCLCLSHDERLTKI